MFVWLGEPLRDDARPLFERYQAILVHEPASTKPIEDASNGFLLPGDKLTEELVGVLLVDRSAARAYSLSSSLSQ
jgi:hypothetical protein